MPIIPTVSAGISFTLDGVYMAIACLGGFRANILIYKRSGNVFTELSAPAILPADTATDCSFSPDGMYLAVVSVSAPFIMIYKRSGDVFDALTVNAPDIQPSSVGSVDSGISFSKDGNYLSVNVGSGTNNVNVYKRVGDTFMLMSAIPSPVSLVNSTDCIFSR